MEILSLKTLFLDPCLRTIFTMIIQGLILSLVTMMMVIIKTLPCIHRISPTKNSILLLTWTCHYRRQRASRQHPWSTTTTLLAVRIFLRCSGRLRRRPRLSVPPPRTTTFKNVLERAASPSGSRRDLPPPVRPPEAAEKKILQRATKI